MIGINTVIYCQNEKEWEAVKKFLDSNQWRGINPQWKNNKSLPYIDIVDKRHSDRSSYVDTDRFEILTFNQWQKRLGKPVNGLDLVNNLIGNTT